MPVMDTTYLLSGFYILVNCMLSVYGPGDSLVYVGLPTSYCLYGTYISTTWCTDVSPIEDHGFTITGRILDSSPRLLYIIKKNLKEFGMQVGDFSENLVLIQLSTQLLCGGRLIKSCFVHCNHEYV